MRAAGFTVTNAVARGFASPERKLAEVCVHPHLRCEQESSQPDGIWTKNFWKLMEIFMLCDQCFLVGSRLEAKREGGKKEQLFGHWKGFTPPLWREKYVVLGNYWNSRFHNQAPTCDLHAQAPKAVILQDLQKLLAASAGSWPCAVDSCVWNILDFYTQFQLLEGHLPPLVASLRDALGTNDHLLLTHTGAAVRLRRRRPG